jgi:uncharacterized membrane protein
VYTELFTLDALCLWCTAVHAITFLLFVVTLVGTMQTADEEREPVEAEPDRG